MANTANIGTCAHCGADHVELTIEHVFPRSWYPDEFRPSEMLTVPACQQCNHSSGRNEDRLFLDLAMMLPDDPRTASLVQRAMRAADPAAGRDQKDSNHRRARGEDLLRRSTILPPDARVPGALWTATGPIAGRVGETEDGTPIEGLVTLYRSHETVEPVIVKFLRCCYFAVYGDPMPREPAPWVRSFTPELQSTLDQFLALPGVVTRGSFPFKFSIVRIGKYAHAWFELWEHLRYFASNQPVPSP